MKKLFLCAAAALSLGAMTSCSTVATGAGMGVLYTEVTEGLAVTSNTLGSKVGTASESSVLGLVCTGNASIQAAAHNAGITKVSHVDVQKKSILGLFSTYTTIVYGQ